MVEDSKNIAPQEAINKKDTGKKGLIIGFIIVLLGINAIQFFYGLNQRTENQEQKEELAIKEKTIHDLETSYDSVSTALDAQIEEYKKLNKDYSELEELKKQIEEEKKNLEKKLNAAQYTVAQYKERLEGYTKILEDRDKEIKNLKAKLKIYYDDNQNLQTQVMTQRDSIRSLEEEKQRLAQIKKEAGQLEVNKMIITAINERNKEKDGGRYRAKDLDKLKVHIEFDYNKFATVGNKTAYIRIVQPDGTTLYNTAMGSGTFSTNTGDEMIYTLKKDFYYENMGSPVQFLYMKGNEYTEGKHTIEVYVDKALTGKGTFEVK